MRRGLLLRYPTPGWASEAIASLFPGGHAVVFGAYRLALEAEEAGFEVRDCITVLGPLRHQVWLLRKPLEGNTVVKQVLATGTGAINIDGTRVAVATTGRRETVKGRWPSNLVLVHCEGCRREGARHRGVSEGTMGRLGRLVPGTENLGYVGEDGLETVLAWECAPKCPVAVIDEQSGERPSIGGSPNISDEGRLQAPGWGTRQRAVFLGFEDKGGASRFFSQFANEAELDTWLRRLIGVDEP